MTNELFDVVFAVETAFMQQFGNSLVFGWMEVTEAVIFQFPFQLPDSETIGQRCVDVSTLFCRQYTFIFRRVFHFTQMGNSLCQLNDHATEIIDHCQQHPAYVIYLLRRYRIGMRGFKLANGSHIPHTMNQMNNRLAHTFTQYVFAHDVGIRQREQQRSPQRVNIHT